MLNLDERSKSRTKAKKDAQDKVVALAAQGLTVKACLEHVNRTYKCYDDWRKKDRNFANRMDHARGVAKGQVESVAFADFRQLYFDRPTPAHHQLMCEAIEGAPLDSITLILAAPESAKTSLLTDYICWKLALDPDFRIAIVSESDDLAKKILGQVARRMTDEEVFGPYIKRYGPFKAPDRESAKPWNAHSITVLRASHDEKEPSVESKGAGGQIYGARYDLLLLDDIQSTTNIGETEKLVGHFRQSMLSRVSAEKGRTVIIGSRVDRGDFYEKILEVGDDEDEPLVDRFVKIPALDDNDESYWPEWWPKERLQRRRKKVGPVAWERAYMQRPIAAGASTFPEAAVRACLDTKVRIGQIAGSEVICSVDPALTGNSAFVALGCDRDHATLLDIEAVPHLARTEEILNRMATFTAHYRPNVWVVEIGAYQGALAEDDRLAEMGRVNNFDIVKHTTTRSKADPSLGVGSMASIFTKGEITLPYANDDETRHKIDGLLKELIAWRPDVPTKLLTQDRVMALWFAYRFWTQRRRLWAPVEYREWRPDFMMPAPSAALMPVM